MKGTTMKPFLTACIALLAGCASVQTSILINAPAKDVRAVLYDFADYPKWNPFLVRVEGDAEEGKQLYVTVKAAGKPELTGDVTVVKATETQLTWKGTAMTQKESGSISVDIPGTLSATHD